MLLRHYLDQGSSKSDLARQLGVSRDTIHRWIRDGDLERDVDAEAVRYGPRPLVATKLDPYKAIIEARLAAYPELSSIRLLDEIRAAGYAGGYSQLKAYVGRVRPRPRGEIGDRSVTAQTSGHTLLFEEFSKHTTKPGPFTPRLRSSCYEFVSR